jgi:hypothetical protein
MLYATVLQSDNNSMLDGRPWRVLDEDGTGPRNGDQQYPYELKDLHGPT